MENIRVGAQAAAEGELKPPHSLQRISSSFDQKEGGGWFSRGEECELMKIMDTNSGKAAFANAKAIVSRESVD